MPGNKPDTTILHGRICEIAGASMLGDIGAGDGTLDFDAPTPEDLYVVAVRLASDLVGSDDLGCSHSRRAERVALWLARCAVAMAEK